MIARVVRSAVWGAVTVTALDAILILSIEFLNFCYWWVGPECRTDVTSNLMRISLVLHPIANVSFNAIILTLFDGHDLSIHSWTPPLFVTFIYYGLLLLESAFYGAVLGMLTGVLCRVFASIKSAEG
mgnify:FL=1